MDTPLDSPATPRPSFLWHVLGATLAAVPLAACGGSSQAAAADAPGTGDAGTGPPDVAAATQGAPLRPLAGEKLGDPIPGLTPSELEAFERGRALFVKRFTPEEGLGPNYNASSCASCHSTPAVGGTARLYRNFYIAMIGDPPGQTKLPDAPSPIVPGFGPHGAGNDTFDLEFGRLPIPEEWFGFPVRVAQRNAIPVFGTGLFEFISDATILANSDPDDLVAPFGISGRPNIDFDGIGRLGLKAQSNNVERFTRPPLKNQMGITTDPFLGTDGTVSLASLAVQGTGNPDDPTLDNDGVPDPEMSHEELGDLIVYSRFLAPADRRAFGPKQLAGQSLFGSIGCADCHVPSLDSSLGPIEAYSDLLLHDMGPELADNLQFGAPGSQGGDPSTGSEWRTQPLWGISMFGPYLHDGRAETLREAIELHGGEAEASRDAFVALSLDDQKDLLSFLRHL